MHLTECRRAGKPVEHRTPEHILKIRFDIRLVPGKTVLLGNGHHRIVASDGTVLWDCEDLTSVDLPYGIYEIDGQRREVSR